MERCSITVSRVLAVVVVLYIFVLSVERVDLIGGAHGRVNFVRHVGRGDSGQLSVIVCRGDLDDVSADQIDRAQGAKHREKLTARRACGFRGSDSRCVCRVEDVDVDGKVHRSVAEPGKHPFDGSWQAFVLEVVT